MDTLAYVKIEVGGIQRFICSTGKLKEMIGGSEIINSLPTSFYENIRNACGLMSVDAPFTGQDWVVEVQRNAGTLCLVLPSQQRARDFLRRFSMEALKTFPGLPLYGTQEPMEWTLESYNTARCNATIAINSRRAEQPLSCGMPMLPVAVAARLDGLPAVGYDKDERISLVSRSRRLNTMRAQAHERLKAMVSPSEGVTLRWKEDLEDMLSGEKQRVALIHIDGNDLGKRFTSELKQLSNESLDKGIQRMRDLSALVDQANRHAFQAAVKGLITLEGSTKRKNCSEMTVPLRPLVMGGDDITIIVRADLALAFVHLFVRIFEQFTAQANKPLSLGVGMVIMPPTYPFVKAFALADNLLENAKHATLHKNPRPSSLDYLIVTEEVEENVSHQRQRIGTAQDKCLLTHKPLLLQGTALPDFLRTGQDVLETLPRSAIRGAMNICRVGKDAAHADWLKLRENLARGLGGRKDSTLMSVARFEHIFPDGYFSYDTTEKQYHTCLGDYLELEQLLPPQGQIRQAMLDFLQTEEGSDV